MKTVSPTFTPASIVLPAVLCLAGCAGTPHDPGPPGPGEKASSAYYPERVEQRLILDADMIRELTRRNPYEFSANLTTGQKVAIGVGTAVAVILILNWLEDEVAFFPPGP